MSFKPQTSNVALFTDPGENGINMAYSRSINPTKVIFKNQKSLFETPRIIISPTVFESFDGKGWLLIGM